MNGQNARKGRVSRVVWPLPPAALVPPGDQVAPASATPKTRIPASTLGLILVLLLAGPMLVSPGEKVLQGEPGELEVSTSAPELATAPLVTPPSVGVGQPLSDGAQSSAPPAAPLDLGAPPRPVVPDTVPSLTPDVIVRPAAPVSPDRLAGLVGMAGIEHFASAEEVPVTMAAPVGPAPIRVLLVDAAAFRPLTPDPTAQAKAVWERLLDGELVVRHDVAQNLQLPLGGMVPLVGPAGQPLPVRIGAFASNGTPPLADAIAPSQLGPQLGAAGPNLLVISVAPNAQPDQVGQHVANLVGGGQVARIDPPVQHQARLVGAGSFRFEPFRYIDHGDGMITIDPAWVRKWIVSADVPIFGGVVRCHRLMMPQLIGALREIEAAGLAGLIDPGDYGGCWVPRHILFSPQRALSMHAWGLAIDFNVRTNGYGATPQLDRRIVEIFQRWGFKWGGDWETPDGMHFELRTVIR
ncbi:MAG: M15 family metallopeptidase [Nitriliruptorales bacterium]